MPWSRPPQPGLQSALHAAIHQRHDDLAAPAALNEEVFDPLVLLAAGMSPGGIRLS